MLGSTFDDSEPPRSKGSAQKWSAIPAIALTACRLGLGFSTAIRREPFADVVGFLEAAPFALRRTYRLSLPVSISSRLAAVFLPVLRVVFLSDLMQSKCRRLLR
jgi:hypothetical protein